MSATHKLNRDKLVSELKRLGWQRDENGWIIPPGRTAVQQDNNWEQAVLAAIECSAVQPDSN